MGGSFHRLLLLAVLLLLAGCGEKNHCLLICERNLLCDSTTDFDSCVDVCETAVADRPSLTPTMRKCARCLEKTGCAEQDATCTGKCL